MSKRLVQLIQKATKRVHRQSRTYCIKQELRRRGLSKALTTTTFTTQDELEALFLLARDCRIDGRILEIGSYLGASTGYLAAGLRGANKAIVCVDTWQNETMPDGIRDTFVEFENNLKSARQHLTLIRKTSSAVSISELGLKFDLIFLDGDHSYAQTKIDFDKFSPQLKQDGVLAFHDSLFFEGVSRVIGEALASAQWQIGGNIRNLFWIKPAQFPHKS